MKTTFATIFTIAAQLFLACAYETPTTGKYFYAQLEHDKAVSYVSMGVGSNDQPLRFLFNTEELTLAMFTKNCSQPSFANFCNVPNPYDYFSDKDRTGTSAANITFETAWLYDQERGITEYEASGQEMLTDFNITLNNYLRMFEYKGYAFAIL